MGKPAQDQTGGEFSTNVQAARDAHFHGLTYEEARQVALDVFRTNALELRGIAQDIASARAEQITNEFLQTLTESQPTSSNSLQDPDMQHALFQAQKEFARSGEDDLKVALVDLLAERAGQTERDLRTLALNEAIESAPKLTERQRRAVAWIFYLRYTRDIASGKPDLFYARFNQAVDALGVDLPTRHADFQHMEYVGVGTVSLSQIDFGAAVRSGSEGLFCNGFESTEVDDELRKKLVSANLLTKSLRNPLKLQLNHLAEENLSEAVEKAGLTSELEEIKSLFTQWQLSDDEVANEATEQNPAVSTLRAAWDSDSGFRNMTLTSVGLALGHAYWSRLTGDSSPLSIWL